MASRRLRAVEPDEVVEKLTVTQAAERGSQRDLLVAMRDRVAKDVESPSTPARDLAALTRRLMEITKEIELLDAKADGAGDEDPKPDEIWDAEAL